MGGSGAHTKTNVVKADRTNPILAPGNLGLDLARRGLKKNRVQTSFSTLYFIVKVKSKLFFALLFWKKIAFCFKQKILKNIFAFVHHCTWSKNHWMNYK